MLKEGEDSKEGQPSGGTETTVTAKKNTGEPAAAKVFLIDSFL